VGSTEARVRAVLGLRSAGPQGSWPEEPVDPDRLISAYGKRYGKPPKGVWHAPGRLALMGEHTVVSDGVGLYVALPWGVTVAVGPSDGPGVHVCTPSGPVAARGTVVGAVERSVDRARRTDVLAPGAGVHVMLSSDLPSRSSLGYAAAVETVIGLALADLGGAPPPERVSVDERVALDARPGHAVRVNFRNLRSTVLPFDPACEDLRLMIIDTGALPRRDLRPLREAELRKAQEVLGPLRSIQDLSSALRRLPEASLRARVEYAVTEVHRLNAAVGLLRAGRFGELGPILSASHLSLRRFELPTTEVDLVSEIATRSGARGVRMTGWRGTVLVLAAVERIDKIGSAVVSAFEEKGWVRPRVRTALPGAGTHRLR